MSTPAKLCLIALLTLFVHLGYMFAVGLAQDPGSIIYYIPYGQLAREELARAAFTEVLVGVVLLVAFAVLLFREPDQ